MPGADTTARVLIVAPSPMTARVFLESSVIPNIVRSPSVVVRLITRDPADRAKAATLGAEWAPLAIPGETLKLVPSRRSRLAALWLWAQDKSSVAGFYFHQMLVFRFNSIWRFRGFVNRRQLSPSLKALSIAEGHAIKSWLGFPFPRSRLLLRLLKSLYYSRWQKHPKVDMLFDDFAPDVVVLGTVQNSAVTPYYMAASSRKLPVVGMVGSWDQPTTKGPLCPEVAVLLAQSTQVRLELETLHDVARPKIRVVGWPQMDIYRALNAEAVHGQLGVPSDRTLLLFAGNPTRLGLHEAEVARRLAEDVRAAAFGEKVTLVIRPHPLDRDWDERFGSLNAPPNVVVMEPSMSDLHLLGRLLRDSSVVMATAGSISLDATFFDSPSIGIGFSLDPGIPPSDRPEKVFEMEHYAAVVDSGGVRLVRSIEELRAAIQRYLLEPDADAEGRRALRESHLGLADEDSGARVASAIKEVLGFASAPVTSR